VEAAYEEAAQALTAVVTQLPVAARVAVPVRCEAPDLELLLAEWLNALVFEMATRHMIFGRYEVHVSGTSLRGNAWGEKVDVDRHQPAVEVKGATYTALKVSQEVDGTWVAQCVVDV
jgi:tRNA nucleotidyltransferase (CCA-adding enzyme)